MADYRYKDKISDDINDALEIVRNVNSTIQRGTTSKNAVLHNLASALKKLESAKYYLQRG